MKIYIEWTNVSEDNIETEKITIFVGETKFFEVYTEGLMSFEFYGLLKNFDNLRPEFQKKVFKDLMDWITFSLTEELLLNE
jgi:hypothetical protein